MTDDRFSKERMGMDEAKFSELMKKARKTIPKHYKHLQNLKLFKFKPLNTDTVKLFRSKSGEISVLPIWCSPTSEGNVSAVHGVPHFKQYDSLGRREVIGDFRFESCLSEFMEKSLLQFNLTLECMMMKCIKGLVSVRDEDIAIRLFEIFDITQKTFELPVSLLGQSTNPLHDNTNRLTERFCEIRNYVEDNAHGSSRIPIVLCSGSFWDKLHENGYLPLWCPDDPIFCNLRDSLKFLRLDLRFLDQNEETKAFVEDDYAYVIPGNSELFEAHYCVPVGMSGTINQLEPPIYVYGDIFGHEYRVVMEMNPLLICKRPEALARIKLVNDK